MRDPEWFRMMTQYVGNGFFMSQPQQGGDRFLVKATLLHPNNHWHDLVADDRDGLIQLAQEIVWKKNE